MSSEFEAIGSMAEAAMIARAVEPKAGDQSGSSEVHGECLNCQTPLMGSHCHNCGQTAQVHRSLAAFGHDILHGVLHFDGKFWHTLPLLVWRPGELTRRYVRGERANFISPMALFLFSIFMMFAIFSFVGAPDFNDGVNKSVSVGDKAAPVNINNWSEGLADQARKLEVSIAASETQLAALAQDDPERDLLEARVLEQKKERNALSIFRGKPAKYPEVQLTENGIITTDENGSLDIGIPVVENFVNKMAKKANKNPELLLYKLQSNGYKFAWLLIPLSIPFVWLATIGKRGYRLYDHAVFTTYSMAFMCLLFITVTLSVKFDFLAGSVVPLAVLFVPLHMYRQLKQAYELSRVGAFIRLGVLLTSISIITVLFLIILVTLGLIG